MSRRARSVASPVSLFAFQDIITSVTAIMILLVLILTLELISRQKLMGISHDDHRVAQELRQSMDTMRERLVSLRSDTSDAKQTALRVAGQSPQELQTGIEETKTANAILASSVASLETQLAVEQTKRREAEREFVAVEKAASAVRLDQEQASRDYAMAQALEKTNTDEAERQRNLEKELAEDGRMVSTLVFNPARGEPLTPILAEVSATGVSVFDATSGEVRNFGWGVLGPSTELSRWLDARDSSREYIVIMLRPSGVSKLKAMRDAVLAKGLQVGIELVGEDMNIVMADDKDTAPSR